MVVLNAYVSVFSNLLLGLIYPGQNNPCESAPKTKGPPERR